MKYKKWCYCYLYKHNPVFFLCKYQKIILQSEKQFQVYVCKTRIKIQALLLRFFRWELNLPLIICSP